MSSAAGELARTPAPTVRTSGNADMFAHAVALLAAVVVVAATADQDSWRVAPLVLIAVFAVVSDLAAVRASFGISVSGSFLGVIVATVTLGGGPAALIGALVICVG
ncbi:MAG: hypothetical protein ACYCXW_23095, partial [Solirubrobacteraceae bacterium]